MTSHYYVEFGAHIRRMDDEVVVYLARSFETHLIDDVGGQILEAVQQIQDTATLCSLSVLCTRLWANAEFDPDIQVEPEAEAVLIPLLNELVRVGVLANQVC